MIHVKRRRWILLIVAASLMAALNIVFIADLSINHLKSEHLTGVLGTEASNNRVQTNKRLSIKLTSDKESVELYVQDKQVYASKSNERGIHVIVLNQNTGGVMAGQVFDTYNPGSEDTMVAFINSLSDQRILCLAIQDEGTFHLKDAGRGALTALGSHLSESLSWRDMWALVTVKGGIPVAEDVSKAPDLASWGSKVTLTASIPLKDADAVVCDWPESAENVRRRLFCSKYEGYGQLCSCSSPVPLTIKSPSFTPNNVYDTPVTIIASNRPQYLYKMLRHLLSAHGSDAEMVTVFIDGFYQEPFDVAGLFGIRAIQHAPLSQKNGRICQHYKSSLTQIFDLYPNAPHTIILEEDLEVSEDFFQYFSQTVELMEQDSSIYCISAWNDQGYDHSCTDPSLLYRVETMPGLGWLLKRQLFKDELEPNWPGPDKLWDWDMWMRTDGIRKGRECIIPDISRTYHFGASGLNMNPYFQEHYFKKHTLNKQSDVKLKNVESLTADNYELLVHGLFKDAILLDHSRDPCDEGFVPDTKNKIYVMYISMNKVNDFDNWMKLATCFHLWDLDARGFHKGLWRFWLKGNQILVVGHPYSPYSLQHKPSYLEPLHLVTD